MFLEDPLQLTRCLHIVCRVFEREKHIFRNFMKFQFECGRWVRAPLSLFTKNKPLCGIISFSNDALHCKWVKTENHWTIKGLAHDCNRMRLSTGNHPMFAQRIRKCYKSLYNGESPIIKDRQLLCDLRFFERYAIDLFCFPKKTPLTFRKWAQSPLIIR